MGADSRITTNTVETRWQENKRSSGSVWQKNIRKTDEDAKSGMK